MTTNNNVNKSLKNSKLFTNKNLGSMPSVVFIGLLSLTLFAFLLTLFYLGIITAVIFSAVFAFLIFIPAFIVHKNDPKGYITWLHVLFKANSLNSDSFKSKKLKLVSLDHDSPFYISLVTYKKK